MKKKNIYLIVFSLSVITAIVAYSFHIGYIIPQKDKHPDWPEFPNHTNKELVLKKDEKSILHITSLPNNDLLLIQYKNPDSAYNTFGIMRKSGKLIKDFGNCSSVYIDEVHNRLLAAHFVNNDTTTYDGYDIKTFKSIPVKYAAVKTKQSFKAYLKQERGVEKIDSTGYKQTIIDYKPGETVDTFKEKYKSKNSKFTSFLENLKELYPFDDNGDGYGNATYVKTDINGVIYNFDADSEENESIRILFKGFFDDFNREGARLFKNKYISKADTSIVVANKLDLNFGSYTRGTAGSGGGSGPLFDPEFEQFYMDYYQIKVNKLTTYFKIDNRKSYLNLLETELNEPKSDNDTLTFLLDGNLYLLYKSVNKK